MLTAACFWPGALGSGVGVLYRGRHTSLQGHYSHRTYSSTSLSHVDPEGRSSMVDVGAKAVTVRTATAQAKVQLGAHVYALVKENRVKKGDVLAVARLAGIMGAKQTSNLIPLCHPIPLTHVSVDFTLCEDSAEVRITSTAKTVGQTGVEMEALTAASVAALTIYDMCKAASHEITITDLCLKHKSGGKAEFHRAVSK
eukprot:comp14181_c0_seq1/m.10124 comp14181_c0_seq1/g.10124  ORF comp14181_c0_seq1/g.10124 comp14181_c0_seq1/m.10124 type:complete len:198 (-) comp14181_c0_seq1:151-744(-)